MFRVLTNIMCELRFSPDYLVHPLLNFRNKSESMFPFQYTEPKLGAVENFARGGGGSNIRTKWNFHAIYCKHLLKFHLIMGRGVIMTDQYPLVKLNLTI